VAPAVPRDLEKNPGERFISAILSEEDLPERKEEVELFVVEGSRAEPALRPIATKFN
jgi:hypothetical protein